MNRKIEKKLFLHLINYYLFVIIYFCVIRVFNMGNSIANLRYYFLFWAMIATLIALLRKKKVVSSDDIYSKELLYTLPLSIFFLLYSFYIAHHAGGHIFFRTYVQVSLIFMPALYAFGLINLFSVERIIQMMKATFVIAVIFYLSELEFGLAFFSPSNYYNLSFANSFTESSLCSGVFTQLFLFFNYFSNAYNSNRVRLVKKSWVFYSFIFAVLSFKRLSILFMIVIILMNSIIDIRGQLNKKIYIIMAIFFTISTFFYKQFIDGTFITSIDVYHFTSGRDYILSLWKQYNYISYGYGSSMILIGRYLEMDLVQIYLELSIFAVFIFSYVYFKIAKKNIYSIMIMVYQFLGLLTASSLPSSLEWIIMLITIGIISSSKLDNENIFIQVSPRRFPRLFSIGKKPNIRRYI